MRRLIACLALSALALAGCASTPTQTPVVDRECYVNYVAPSSLGAVIAAPSDQPTVRSPWDCRYTETKAADGTITGALDPKGCYGLDPGGSVLIYREDFCPSVPAGS